ncbi:MAG TPA: DedA family protein [Ktedonobacterales bacterium]
MPQFDTHALTHLLTTYGYWAVLVFVAIESTGIPFPGETMLLAASIYAGTTHHLQLPFIILAAAAGAILGDNLGFFVGREGGFRLLRRYGRYIRLDERRLKLGIYLFRRHGGKVVFFGRFVAVLRAWAAFLAGVNRMQWDRFLVFNAAGGILWAIIFGTGGYLLGGNVHRFTGVFGRVTIGLALVFLVIAFIWLRRNERALEDAAEAALPGPLGAYTDAQPPDSGASDMARPDEAKPEENQPKQRQPHQSEPAPSGRSDADGGWRAHNDDQRS